MLTRDACNAILERALAASGADELSLSIEGGRTTHLRFARNTPSTSGDFTDASLSVTSTFGTKSGTARVNLIGDPSSDVDRTAIATAVGRSEQIARRSPEDPEHMPVLGPQELAEIDAWSARTAEEPAELLAAGAARCIEDARAAGLVAAGFAQATAGFDFLGTSNGLSAYRRATTAYFSETVRTVDGTGSGWATAAGTGVEDMDFAVASSTAMSKAYSSASPQALEPGRYPAILEPACVANLLSIYVRGSSARSADEGRSWFSAPGGGTRLGEQAFPETVSLWTDPADARAPGSPWGSGGLPQKKRWLVNQGRIESLNTDRFWARKTGVEPVPSPSNVLMEGGSGSVADLVARTERAVLITSIWYIRSVDPRTMLYTGLTRDGVFWVEDGRIVKPLTNFRWNDSPVAMLEGVRDLSAAVRVPPRASRSNTWFVPAVSVDGFTLSSVSEAV